MDIRRAKRADEVYLNELYAQLEKDAVFYQPQHFVMSEKGARICDELFDSERQAVFAAEDNGEVVGFIHVKLLASKDIPCLRPEINVYIQDMVVSEKCRNKGIGTQLIETAKEYGRKNGASFVRTQVFPMNEDGLRFYRRNGFAETMITIECPLD